MTVLTTAFAERKKSSPPGGRPLGIWRAVIAVAAVLAGTMVGVQPVLGLAAAGVVCLGVVVLAKPDWATLAAVAMLYSNAAVVAHRVHGLPRPVAEGAALLVAVALVNHLGVRRRPFLIPAALPWVVVFLIVQVIGAARAVEPVGALESIRDFVTSGLFLYLAFSNAIRSQDVLRSVLWILLLVGAGLGGLGLHQSLTGNFENDYGGFAQIKDETLEQRALAADDEAPDPRSAGPIGEKNFYAQMMFVLVPIGLMLSLGAIRWRHRILAFGFTALVAAGGALPASRGGAVGLVLAVLILTVARYLPVRYLVVVAVGIALLLSVSPRYVERLTTLGSVSEVVGDDGATGDVDSAVMGRLGANAAGLRVFAEHPILGVGPGMFNTHYREQALEAGYRVHEDSRSAHNLYLHIAAEFGLIGFIALFGAVAVTLRDLRRARRAMYDQQPVLAAMLAGIFGAIVTYLTTGLFLSLSYERYFWLLMALGAAGVSVASRADSDSYMELTAVPTPPPPEETRR